MENSQEQLARYMQDLHAAERGLEDILKGHVEHVDTPSTVRQACSAAAQAARTRMAAIDLNLTRIGGTAGSVRGLVNRAAIAFSDMWSMSHDATGKMTMELIKSHAAAHLIHASYFALHSYAKSIGDQMTEQLAEQGIRDSAATAKSLLPMIGHLAMSAATER